MTITIHYTGGEPGTRGERVTQRRPTGKPGLLLVGYGEDGTRVCELWVCEGSLLLRDPNATKWTVRVGAA
jgi:hypothetical protein